MIVKVYRLKEIEVGGIKLQVGVDTIEPKLPVYGKQGDACMDVYPICMEYDAQRDMWIYHTGLVFAIGGSITRMEVPYDKVISIDDVKIPNEMELRPRSNLTKSDFYMPNSPGTLDWGYRGELLLVFKNRTSNNLVQTLNTIITAIDRLSMRVGCSSEIRQYVNIARKNLEPVSKSINTAPYKCNGEDRCCQLIIRGSERIEWQEVEDIEELGTTDRGDGGFGSTGGAVK